MFVVAGVSGNTGKVVAETLLARGAAVRVLVRDESKGAAWRARGAEVAVGRIDHAAELGAALRGARGAYLLSPPDFAAQDQLARRREFTDSIAAAVRAAGVPHVVFLSSVGAHQPDGTGVIAGLYPTERALNATGAAVTHVRAAYFMENLASVVHPARSDGVLPSFFDPAKPIAMIATADIGRVAAEALLEGPSAAGVIELEGPARYSMNDAAALFAARLGRAVQGVRVPNEAIVPTLTGMGFVPDLARLYAEMAAGIENGRVDFEGGAARHVRGRIGLEAIVAQLV